MGNPTFKLIMNDVIISSKHQQLVERMLDAAANLCAALGVINVELNIENSVVRQQELKPDFVNQGQWLWKQWILKVYDAKGMQIPMQRFYCVRCGMPMNEPKLQPICNGLFGDIHQPHEWFDADDPKLKL